MIPLVALTTPNYTDTLCTNGVYFYAVVAGTELINGTPSNCENVTVTFPLDSPSLTPIVPNPNRDGIIQLNWSAVPGATHYYVYRALSNITSTVGLVPLRTVTNTSCLDTVNLSGWYYYAIRAVNATCNSSLSNCEGVQVVLLEIPGFEFTVGFAGLVTLVVLVWYLFKHTLRFLRRPSFQLSV